jgi:hypothetical protein
MNNFFSKNQSKKCPVLFLLSMFDRFETRHNADEKMSRMVAHDNRDNELDSYRINVLGSSMRME